MSQTKVTDAMRDTTSLDVSDLSGAVPVAKGGTGVTAVGTSGNVLTSNGSAWASTAPAAGGITASDQAACQAWVNYNQSSSTAIADDYGISSLTDEGTGDCTISFDSAMGNTNYAVAGVTTQRGFCCIQTDPMATGSFRITTRYSNGLSFSDFDQTCIIVFGD
jgi:hypothetical protein